MSQTTLSRTVNTVEDIRVGLNNSSICRLLSIGTTWNYLRIGVRMAIDPAIYGTSFLGKNIFVGVCSGTSNPWNNGAATTTHAVGVLAPSTGYAAIRPNISSQGAGDQNYNFYGPKGAKRIGTTITESTNIIVTDNILSAYANYKANMWLIDIEKQNSPTAWNIKIFCPNASPLHLTKESFESHMVTTFASLSVSNYWGGTQTLAVDEATDGYLDTVNVFSDCPGNIEICDVAVARFS